MQKRVRPTSTRVLDYSHELHMLSQNSRTQPPSAASEEEGVRVCHGQDRLPDTADRPRRSTALKRAFTSPWLPSNGQREKEEDCRRVYPSNNHSSGQKDLSGSWFGGEPAIAVKRAAPANKTEAIGRGGNEGNPTRQPRSCNQYLHPTLAQSGLSWISPVNSLEQAFPALQRSS